MSPPSRVPSARTAVPAKAATAAKKTAKAAPAAKAPAKTPAKAVKKAAKTPAKAAKKAAKAAPAPKKTAQAAKAPAARRPGRARALAGPYADDPKFLAEQRAVLLAERAVYQEQAESLKAEADALAQEREPGDVQFDEESGEGGTVTVDRERDLALSAQALAAVEEIEAALERIAKKTYGACERCHQPILKARLRALPYARLCVACKSGGLSRR